MICQNSWLQYRWKQARLLQCTALWHVSKKIAKLQRTQNNLARVVCNNKDSSTHSETLLHQLHWLRVGHRIEYKLAVSCYKAFRTGQPGYLVALLSSYKPARLLRSNAMELLNIPPHKIEMAARRFSLLSPCAAGICVYGNRYEKARY